MNKKSLTKAQREQIKQLIDDIKALGYKKDSALNGVDRLAFGNALGVTYHAVRYWLCGENPIPMYVLKFVERSLEVKKLRRRK